MTKGRLLPFLGHAVNCLTGMATTKDTTEIKQWVHLLIKKQTQQQETLVHVISILNITRYTTQVHRLKINKVMDALQKSSQDINIILSITDVLIQCLRYHQIDTYAHTTFACLSDCFTYMKQVTTHTVDYVDAATTNVLSPNILPVKELKGMLRHIESQLPSIMHLPISLDNTLHFYGNLIIHVLVAEENFSYS